MAAPAPGASYVDIPLSGMRETIAKRLTAAKQTIPHYQLSVTVNVEKTLAMRKAVNEKGDVKVSVNISCFCVSSNRPQIGIITHSSDPTRVQMRGLRTGLLLEDMIQNNYVVNLESQCDPIS